MLREPPGPSLPFGLALLTYQTRTFRRVSPQVPRSGGSLNMALKKKGPTLGQAIGNVTFVHRVLGPAAARWTESEKHVRNFVLGLVAFGLTLGVTWSVLDHRLFLLLKNFRADATLADLAYFGEAGGMQFGLSLRIQPDKFVSLRPLLSDLFSQTSQLNELESEQASEESGHSGWGGSKSTVESPEGSVQKEIPEEEDASSAEHLMEAQVLWAQQMQLVLSKFIESGTLDLRGAVARRRIWMRSDIANQVLKLAMHEGFAGLGGLSFKQMGPETLDLEVSAGQLLSWIQSACGVSDADSETGSGAADLSQTVGYPFCGVPMESFLDWLDQRLPLGIEETQNWKFHVRLFWKVERDLIRFGLLPIQQSNANLDPVETPPEPVALEPGPRAARLEKMIGDSESLLGRTAFGALQVRQAMLQNHLLQVLGTVGGEGEGELSEFWESPRGTELASSWEEKIGNLTSWSSSSLWAWSRKSPDWRFRADFENPDLLPGEESSRDRPRWEFVNLVERAFSLRFFPETGFRMDWKEPTVLRIEGTFVEAQE